jgi:5-methylcytosine-specific restriction endonuclease McrA
METLQEFHFDSIYELADIIDGSVKAEAQFWNYDDEFFIRSAISFSKDTLLHLYIVTTAMNFYRRDFRKNGDCIDEEDLDKWYKLFEIYKIEFKKSRQKAETPMIKWFEKYEDIFFELFDKMADEVFYILFSNRKFLLNFNNLVALAVKQDLKFPAQYLAKKGTIKRALIPQWVKKAVYHRDKGRCVFCNTDLTGIINFSENSNYDHIVPLDLFGVNDPCNIQLACEKCNKSKTNKDGATSSLYMPWWKR